MSYPKAHPIYSQSPSNTRAHVKTQKREQIKQMLINKFRTKYRIQLESDSLDAIIRDEIDQIMMQETVTESTLLELDKKIQQRVSRMQNPEENEKNFYSVKPLESRGSNRSYHSQMSKQSKPLRSSQSQRSNLSIQSKTLQNQGEFTEDAWVDILKFNSTMFQQEQEELKKKQYENKQRVKEELAKQVAEKKNQKLKEMQEEQDYFIKQKQRLEEEERNEKRKQLEMTQKMKTEALIRSSQQEMQNMRRSQEVVNERQLGNQMRYKMEQDLKQEQERIRRKLDEFKRQQLTQLVENKRLREEAVKKEIELDNYVPSGHDLMHQIYLEKTHVSYEKRAKMDEIFNKIKDQVEGGESNLRIQKEVHAMNNYIKTKEQQDKLNDEIKRKKLKQRELETKRILDIQLQERMEQERLKKYENNFDCKIVHKDIESYEITEKRKLEEDKNKKYEHNSKLVKQIEDKKKPMKLDPIEFEMNKALIMKIQSTKTGAKTQLLSPQRSVSQFKP